MNIILITGGAFQGKREFAKNEFPQYPVLSDIHLLIKEELSKDMEEADVEREIFSKLNEAAVEDNIVVISDDIGYGIVPLDPFERKWREVTGRIISDIAKEAASFFRVTAGIGERLK